MWRGPGREAIHNKDIDILFGEPQRNLRQTLRSVLSREGFSKIRDTNNLAEFESILDTEFPDLLIMDAQMGKGDTPTELVRRMRHGKFGRNPYIPIILTIWEPTKELVRAVAASGADDLLVKPLAPHIILERIKALAFNRKQFVVASDYIGPDRRKKSSPSRGGEEIPTFDVPNTLKTKSLGKHINKSSLEQEIAKARSQINNLKLERNAFQMSFLVELILPIFGNAAKKDELRRQIGNLFVVSKDTADRLDGSAYDHVADLCASMVVVTRTLVESASNPEVKDVKLLKPLTEAILLACNPESDSASLAGKITDSISRYKSKITTSV